MSVINCHVMKSHQTGRYMQLVLKRSEHWSKHRQHFTGISS